MLCSLAAFGAADDPPESGAFGWCWPVAADGAAGGEGAGVGDDAFLSFCFWSKLPNSADRLPPEVVVAAASVGVRGVKKDGDTGVAFAGRANSGVLCGGGGREEYAGVAREGMVAAGGRACGVAAADDGVAVDGEDRTELAFEGEGEPV